MVVTSVAAVNIFESCMSANSLSQDIYLAIVSMRIVEEEIYNGSVNVEGYSDVQS